MIGKQILAIIILIVAICLILTGFGSIFGVPLFIYYCAYKKTFDPNNNKR